MDESLSHVLNGIEDAENIKIIDIQKILQEEYDFDSSSFDCLNKLA